MTVTYINTYTLPTTRGSDFMSSDPEVPEATSSSKITWTTIIIISVHTPLAAY